MLFAPVPYRPQPLADHRAQMARLIDSIAAELPPVECPVFHHFSPGVYAREMHIPAGAVVVGKIHKFENMLMLVSGIAELRDGENAITVRAPRLWVSPPGVQRAVFAITDCIFMSVHGTEKRDVNEIEAELIAQNALEYEQFLLTHNEEGA